jgi:hypothetical protein
MKFSQRMGLTPVESAFQTEGMNDALRNSLWNVFDGELWSTEGFLHDLIGDWGHIDDFSRALWSNFFKQRVDSRGDNPYQVLENIQSFFFESQWFEVYDFIEFVAGYYDNKELSEALNQILERELAGFRLISGSVAPVTAKEEVEAVKEAIEDIRYKGTVTHLRQALNHLSNRKKPDYRNSIKESICAVESLARELTKNPKATLGDALQLLEKTDRLHPALKRGLSALYGYTSDEQGIRHAMLEEPDLTATDATFFLVSCSAFINYLKAKTANDA